MGNQIPKTIMKRPEQFERGSELIAKVLDQSVSEAEFGELQQLLEEDGALRHVYMQMVDQEVELGCCGSTISNKVRLFPPQLSRFVLAAAALVLISLLVFALFSLYSQNDDVQIVEPETEDPQPSETIVRSRPPRDVPPAPAIWAADFENGIPPGWEGEFVTTGLPEGSRGAIRTIPKSQDGREYRQLLPPASWAPGHVRIGANTHLHLTLKVEQAAAYDVFMLTHVPNPARSELQLYKFGEAVLWEGEGQWRRLSIPLKWFAWKDQATETFVEDDAFPEAGEIAWQLFISSSDPDFKVVIDEWRVDDIGTGEVVVGLVN